MAIRFYKEFGDYGFLATYSNHGFIKDGIYYKTSEHYYQSKKFEDKNIVKRIIDAPTPREASNIGRDKDNKIRKNWRLIKNYIMFEAVLYKFLNNKDIREKLLNTGNEMIIEETTKENYWGCGPNKDGHNYYGKILCDVRDYLRKAEKNEGIIDNLVKEHPEIEKYKKGFPNIGKREDGKEFGTVVRKIEKAWYYYDTELYNIDNDSKTIKLGSGNPLNYKAFPLSIRNLKKELNNNLYEYPAAAGDEEHRKQIAKYLINEGYPKDIDFENIIITNSTTEAFYMILKSIFKPNDVIIMTSPNYGLFAFMPERLNIDVKTVELKKENDFLINPVELDDLIKKINKELDRKYKNEGYKPRVKCFLNMNPHNPLGTVLSDQDDLLLKSIGEVCKKNEVFIIDDLVYRDLSYDRFHIAKPIATLEDYFDNSISLFGLSKSYGLAKTRSGFVVANKKIIRLLRDNLFYIMDSPSILQSSLLAGAYNDSSKRKRIYDKYFKKIINKYIYNCYLCIALFDGIESIKNTKYYDDIKVRIKKIIKDKKKQELVLRGVPFSKVVLVPKSGFFLLVDFTELKKYGIINSEKDLLYFIYRKCGIKFLIGQSFSWPNENELIIRITYSFSPEELITSISKINFLMRGEKNETN